MRKKLGIMVLSVFAAMATIEVGNSYLSTGQFGIGEAAHAIIGRPLTPVSVAGVARRCSVGIC
ncbi:MAG: hypothetical protein NTX73_17915 [Rhodobacterales bacterium]|jgi:hypothetical protein|nr:hypothetical protein [Rhodobacterales bacterium]